MSSSILEEKSTPEPPEETETIGGIVSDVNFVLEFLRSNGFTESELALKEDIIERSNGTAAGGDGGGDDHRLGSVDFEKFLFDLPPVRIPSAGHRRTTEEEEKGGGGGGGSQKLRRSRFESSSSDDDEFVSLASSTTGVCSSEFTNPYGLHSASRANSETSDGLSQFGTARDYPDFDMQNDQNWYDEKDDGYFMTPCFEAPNLFNCPTEDKFITTSEVGNDYENSMVLYDNSQGYERDATNYLDESYPFNTTFIDVQNEAQAMNHYDVHKQEQFINDYLVSQNNIDVLTLEDGNILAEYNIAPLQTTKKSEYHSKKALQSGLAEVFESPPEIIQNVFDNYVDDREVKEEAGKINSSRDENDDKNDELPIVDSQGEDYDIFDLRIIHRKNRTGFEENKELPIVLNTIIGGRYYVTEFLGSAAFSRVIQAHDLHTGVDVCLKIIKNDKDFFDQSLDEIKLLKLVNKYDPADQRHILRLYDYFYHQEHLFLVCELLRANLYEFQKFTEESGGERYFTLSRLQTITRQCLEALEYLHHLGIIHCDLKPENILIKSYRRCEIKVIDLGSSCFLTDNLCMYVQSRSYRAPEVILGLPYDQKIDLWSLGCILAELYSGEVLFPNNVVVMILARMIGLLGPIDLDMLERGQETHKYFTKDYDLYHLNEETNEVEYIIPEESSLEHHLQISDVGFIDFLCHLLEINPLLRLTATEALQHPWLSHSYESNS